MTKMILKVTKQKLELDTDTVAEGAINYATFELHCDSTWSGFAKTVRFSKDDVVFDVPNTEEGTVYYIPHEVLSQGEVFVGVVGVSQGNRVATTKMTSFHVHGAIASGSTPTVSPDAYAKYVYDVSRHSKTAKEAEARSLECLERCKEIICCTEKLAATVTDAVERAENLHNEVLEMMNAVGMAFREVKESERKIASVNSKYSADEHNREKGERARVFNENKRAVSEDERRQSEMQREAAEIRRNTAEQVRSFNDVRRDNCLKEIEGRVTVLESEKTIPVTCIYSMESGEGELLTDSYSEVESITLYGHTASVDGKLHGVGEDGFVTFSADGEDVTLSVSEPLYGVGDIADTVTVTARGEVTVLHRTEKICINGNESFTCDKGEDGSVMYITPVSGRTPLYENCDIISSSSAPNRYKGVFVNGDYLFFSVDGDIYPTVSTFAESLRGQPVELIYPILRPYEENEGSTDLDGLPNSVGYSGKITAEVKKDVFKALKELSRQINELNKKENNENENT